MKRKGVPGLLSSVSIVVVGIILIIAPMFIRIQTQVASTSLFLARQQTSFIQIFIQTVGPQLGLMLLLTGIFMSMWYSSRFDVFRRMDNGEDVYARWSYGQTELDKLRRQALKKVSTNPVKKSPVFFVVVAIIALINGIRLWAIYPANTMLFLIGAVGCCVLIAGVYLLSRGQRRKAILQDSGEVIISHGGVWLIGQLFWWDGKFTRLEKAEVMKNSTSPVLLIQYTYLVIFKDIVEIPIPEGHEKEAREAARQLMLRPN